MAKTVEELFKIWLDDNGKDIVEDEVDLGEMLSEYISDNFKELCESRNFDFDDVVADAIADRVQRDSDVERDVREYIKDSFENGEWTEEITEAIEKAVDAAVGAGMMTMALQDLRNDMAESISVERTRINNLERTNKEMSEFFHEYRKIAEQEEERRRWWWRMIWPF